jgi:hypothetical protein
VWSFVQYAAGSRHGFVTHASTIIEALIAEFGSQGPQGGGLQSASVLQLMT